MQCAATSQSGSTLIEVVLAGFLVSLSVLSLTALYGQSAYVLSHAQRYQAAVLFSADLWELTQWHASPELKADFAPDLVCQQAMHWQQVEQWVHWQQRLQCQLPQVQADVSATARGLSLQWFGLKANSSGSADLIFGVQP